MAVVQGAVSVEPMTCKLECDAGLLTFIPRRMQWTDMHIGQKIKAFTLNVKPSTNFGANKRHEVDTFVYQRSTAPNPGEIRVVTLTCSAEHRQHFILNCRYIVSEADPEVLIILDPGVNESEFHAFFDSLGFPYHMYQNPTNGFKGVFILWKDRKAKATVIDRSKMLMRLLVTRKP